MANDTTIYNWNQLKHLGFDSLILGNGASIAIDSCFSYRSLYEIATNGSLSTEVQRVFERYQTCDFEFVLKMLWRTHQVNQLLGVCDPPVEAAYNTVRNALIETVHRVHVDYQLVEPYLPQIHQFMQEFENVFSLNYDLIVYWAMIYGNKEKSGNWYKDCFAGSDQTFIDDVEWMRKPIQNHLNKSTMVFYPHGNLVLATNVLGQELKLCARENSALLDNIVQRWSATDSTPLFVSEGDSDQKLRSINRNAYLHTIYSSVLKGLHKPSICVYGWALGRQDEHLIKAIGATYPSKLAISVYTGDPNYKKHCEMILHELPNNNNFYGFKYTDISFYDSSSQGCWIHPDPIF